MVRIRLMSEVVLEVTDTMNPAGVRGGNLFKKLIARHSRYVQQCSSLGIWVKVSKSSRVLLEHLWMRGFSHCPTEIPQVCWNAQWI
ncbi:hypothetical protein TNCV_1340571 [Trichonephila clavipes]|nr:hypothetical protein TNCV_1340571 [Trichonephila clavipes]